MHPPNYTPHSLHPPEGSGSRAAYLSYQDTSVSISSTAPIFCAVSPAEHTAWCMWHMMHAILDARDAWYMRYLMHVILDARDTWCTWHLMHAIHDARDTWCTWRVGLGAATVFYAWRLLLTRPRAMMLKYLWSFWKWNSAWDHEGIWGGCQWQWRCKSIYNQSGVRAITREQVEAAAVGPAPRRPAHREHTDIVDASQTPHPTTYRIDSITLSPNDV